MSKVDQMREAAEADLAVFINLVHPQRVLGGIHRELLEWFTRSEAKSYQLCLLPRDHGKSAMIAYRVAWEITRNPAVRILYLSATSTLAEKQLKFVKDILDSKIYRRYWPEMTNVEEGKREKWTNSEISVDHPLRKAEAIRDPTVFTGGLTTGITGLHFDVIVYDDIVVPENAYTEEGREKVRRQYSMTASIQGTEGQSWVVGTRYHPADIYSELLSMSVPEYSDEGEFLQEELLFEVFERQVEDIGDGSGQYLWPRQQRYDGKWYGFDRKILEKKKAQYIDKTQFRAQYYNDPNDAESAPLSRDLFQYYNKALVSRSAGSVVYNGRRLNVFAAIDFAYATTKKADSTSIVVVGVDWNNNHYILDIERFKSGQIKDYFDKIVMLHNRWMFRKIRAEINGAQEVIVNELKNYVSQFGISLVIDPHRVTRHQGTKEERMFAALNPKYENKQVWHFKGGNCEILEEELVLQNPPHDDIKDALTACFGICVPPVNTHVQSLKKSWEGKTHSRFGGIG